MKKMIKSVFAAVAICGMSAFVSPVYAQHGYTPQERRAIDKALSVIEDYETASSLNDDDAYDSFLGLFANEDVEVYNDLLGLSGASILKAGEYAELQRQNTRNSQVFVSDIRRENLWKDGASWKVQFAFDKTISYTNKCGAFFSSNDFYGVKHHLHAVLVYDADRDVCRIERITGKIDSDKKLPDNFYTLQAGGEKGRGLKYNGMPIECNSYGQAYLEAPVTKNQFSYSDADVVAVPKIDEECKFVSMTYKSREWAVKAHYDMGIGNAYSLDKDIYKSTKSSSNSFGLDFGHIFPSKSMMKLGIFLGFGVSKSTLDLDYASALNQFNATADQDVDGDTYIRRYRNVSLAQTYRMTDFNVPLYVDLDIHFSRIVSLYVDLGVKMNFNLSNKVDATSGEATVEGLYEQYGDLVMNGLWVDENGNRYNGFGHHDYSNSDLVNSELKNFSKFTLDAMGGLGLRFCVPKIPVYLDLGINYQYGFMNLIKESDRQDMNNVMYNSIYNSTSTEHVRNLIEGSKSLRRSRLSFNIGLIYKF